MAISGPAKTRDIRIDLARSVCLWFILVDHTAANVLNQLTLRNFAICDAADVFVFLCGVSASLAYGTKLDHAGWWEASKAVLRRVRAIYIAQLVLIIMVAALLIASRALGQLEVARFFWLHEQAFSATALIRLACLVDRSSLLGLGILPLYIALLSWFALIIPLVRRPLCLLALSGGLWSVVHLCPSLRAAETFNPLAWQLTFTLGVLCCRYAYLLRRPELRILDIAAIGLLAADTWAVLMLPQTWEFYHQFGLPVRVLLRGADKLNLDPARVISVLSLAWIVFRHVPPDARWLRASWATTLIALGQHSLPVFAVGIVVSGVSSWALLVWQQSFGSEVLVNTAGLAAMVLVAGLSMLRPGKIVRMVARANLLDRLQILVLRCAGNRRSIISH
ncbi:MAG: OpgC domain-containing protein [Acetobacteraceae bacterium]|nr:OpgC domain-containing protein [Acetobacteraceae bacterium]